MPLLVTNHSTYPRIGDRPEEQRIRRALDQRDREEIGDRQLESVYHEVVSEILREQEKAGVDLVTDGLIRWYDPISHIMRGFKGVKVGGLLRFFDTNFYFRVPVVEGRIETRDGLLASEVSSAVKGTKRSFKAVLTGPLTLASLSEVGKGSYPKGEDLISDLTDRLALEVEAIAQKGVAWIQVEEPILLKKPGLLPLLDRSLREFAKRKGEARLVLATYFGDAAPLYEKMQALPVDALAWDLAYGGNSLKDKIAALPGEKVLFLGLVDGRTTRLEFLEDLQKTLKKLRVESLKQEVYLTSSCGLEYLPRNRAFEKLKLLTGLKGRA